MQLVISCLFDSTEDNNSVLDVFCTAEFEDPKNVSLAHFFQSNPGIVSYVEEAFDIKFEVTYDKDFVTLNLMKFNKEEDENSVAVTAMIDDITDSFIENLKKVGFKIVTKATTFLETFVDLESNTAEVRPLNQNKLLN